MITVKELVKENKHCTRIILINYITDNIYLAAPLHPTKTYPHLNYFEEIVSDASWYSDKKVAKYEIKDFGVSEDDPEAANIHITIYTI